MDRRTVQERKWKDQKMGRRTIWEKEHRMIEKQSWCPCKLVEFTTVNLWKQKNKPVDLYEETEQVWWRKGVCILCWGIFNCDFNFLMKLWRNIFRTIEKYGSSGAQTGEPHRCSDVVRMSWSEHNRCSGMTRRKSTPLGLMSLEQVIRHRCWVLFGGFSIKSSPEVRPQRNPEYHFLY